MSEYYQLRPARSGSRRAPVRHVFSDEDYWWPYRSAMCGKEYDGSTLTDENLHIVALCYQCGKFLSRLEEEVAA